MFDYYFNEWVTPAFNVDWVNRLYRRLWMGRGILVKMYNPLFCFGTYYPSGHSSMTSSRRTSFCQGQIYAKTGA